MKIISHKLTPLFDQYSNNENRLIHALLHTIGGSERILRLFLKEVIGFKGKIGGLETQWETQWVSGLHSSQICVKGDVDKKLRNLTDI
jgi:hypothetical protein